MEELKINTKLPISTLEELDIIEISFNNLLNSKSKVRKENFSNIIEYNRKIITKEIESDFEQNEILESLKIRIRNKTTLTEILKQIKTSKINEVDLDSNYILYIEKKLYLKDIYNSFNVYCKDLVENLKHIAFIKIYDFYEDKDDFKNILNNIRNKDESLSNINRLLAYFRYETNELDFSKIKVLTGINSALSFDFYTKLYNYKNPNHKDSNINIKYIPESTSRNRYIPSLFYIIIKYADENKNYKYLIAYLESSTNWGVVTVTRPNAKNFSSQFFNLLNIRFDEQYENSSILFKPNTNKNYIFENDIDNIFKLLKKYSNNNKVTEIDKDILNEIHILKTKYKKIDQAYTLIKSYYYYYSYLHKIRNLSNIKKFPNTNYIVKNMLKNNLTKKTKKMLQIINANNIDLDNINTYELRLAIISEIKNEKSICDIFPKMNWTRKIDIIQNLEEIKINPEFLEKFFKKLGICNELNLTEKQTIFNEKVVENIKKGNKIEI